MNKILFPICLVGLLFTSTTLFATDRDQQQTLFQNSTVLNPETWSYVLVPTVGVTQLDGSTAALLGLRGGIKLSNPFTFGAFFQTSVLDVQPESETLPDIYMDFWTVGGYAEYTLFSNRLLHATFPVLLGIGEVEMDNEPGDLDLGEKNFLVVEPTALLELNVLPHVRLNLGAGYRFVSSMQYRNLNQADISGWTGQFGIKVCIRC
jgi:hypothetical protein